MHSVIQGAIKVFGFFYFLFHTAMTTAMLILIIFTLMSAQADNASLGLGMLILPLLGMASGYWLRHGNTGAWRRMLIALSLMTTLGGIYLIAVIVPNLL